MGLFNLLLFPVTVPLAGVQWLGAKVADAVDAQWNDPARIEAALLALERRLDAGELTAADTPAVRTTCETFDRVLGVLSLRRIEDERPPVPVEEIEALIEARKAARLARNFAEADRIRTDLDARGILLEDTGSVTRWKRK